MSDDPWYGSRRGFLVGLGCFSVSTIVLFLSFELFFEPLRDNPSF